MRDRKNSSCLFVRGRSYIFRVFFLFMFLFGGDCGWVDAYFSRGFIFAGRVVLFIVFSRERFFYSFFRWINYSVDNSV